MQHTAHVAKFYWEQWKRSGGELDENGRARSDRGNATWFHKYWRECDVSYGVEPDRRPWL